MSQSIGEALRQLRVIQKRSRESLAAEAGVSETTLGNLEHGHGAPFYSTVVAVAGALGHVVTLAPAQESKQ